MQRAPTHAIALPLALSARRAHASEEPQAGAGPVHMRIVDLHKSYGDHHVLKGVTFDVYRGATNLIVGVSGSGKTVLLRQLISVERPDSGRVEIDGVDLVSLDELALVEQRKKFGMVFQDAALFDSLTVFDNVAFPLREHSGLGKREIEARVLRQLEVLGVADARDKRPSELSGGMKKRVAVARAMVSEPQVLIYDEPTRGLDPLLARSVDQLIEQTRRRYGVTSIVISHDVKSIADIAHYVNVLDDGRIVYSATRDEFLACAHPLARAFVRASGVIVPAHLPARTTSSSRLAG